MSFIFICLVKNCLYYVEAVYEEKRDIAEFFLDATAFFYEKNAPCGEMG